MRNIYPHITRLAPLLPQLGFALRRRAGELPAALGTAANLGERHVAVLVSVAVAGPATVTEIARRMDMTLAHASLVVGDLARAGLVTREHDQSDRRRIVVSLAEAARPAVAEMRARTAAPLARFLSGLSDDEAEAFVSRLTELVACLNATDEPESPGPRPAPRAARAR